MEDYKEKSDYESYTITRLNNGWLVEANEYQVVFQDDDDGKFKHEESESLFRLIRDTFGDLHGRWKRQGGFTIEFNDKGYEQE